MATSAADPQGQEGHSLTRAGEDYLESIYRLSLERDRKSTRLNSSHP